jgi:hypothetical protein
MIEKVLIPLLEDDVAPRFDLATDALVIAFGPAGEALEERTVVLAHASADELCKLILTEHVGAVICGGIEDEYYQYLSWKKVRVIDSVIGPARAALARLRDGTLTPATVLAEVNDA